MKKYLKKFFIVTSLLFLTFILNLELLNANSSNCNNYTFDKIKYLNRLNSVLDKIKTGNKSADKMQTLLNNLKTKYSSSSNIKEMIRYLDDNIKKNNSLKCVIDNTIIDTGTTTHSTGAILDNNSIDEACKVAKKFDCHSDNGGDAFITVNGAWCLNGKAFDSVQKANNTGVYCGEQNLKGLCTVGEENPGWTCTGSGYVSNAIPGQNPWCFGTKYYPKLEKAKDDGINCIENLEYYHTGATTSDFYKTTNVFSKNDAICKTSNAVEQKKYTSFYNLGQMNSSVYMPNFKKALDISFLKKDRWGDYYEIKLPNYLIGRQQPEPCNGNAKKIDFYGKFFVPPFSDTYINIVPTRTRSSVECGGLSALIDPSVSGCIILDSQPCPCHLTDLGNGEYDNYFKFWNGPLKSSVRDTKGFGLIKGLTTYYSGNPGYDYYSGNNSSYRLTGICVDSLLKFNSGWNYVEMQVDDSDKQVYIPATGKYDFVSDCSTRNQVMNNAITVFTTIRIPYDKEEEYKQWYKNMKWEENGYPIEDCKY